MQNIKNIILDYGNVIFSIDFSLAQRAFEKLGVNKFKEIYGHLAQNDIFDSFDKGTISAAEFRDRIRVLGNDISLTDEQIDEAWNALLIGVREGHHELLLQLKEKYRLFLLSNNNEIHYQWIMEYLQREHGLSDNAAFFEQDYYSHLMGMRKPDAEIFQFVMDRHGLIPAQTVFVDDSPQHIATAERLGLQAYLLKTGDTLPALLERIGLM